MGRYSWPPCTSFFSSAAFELMNIIYFFTEQGSLMRRSSVLSLSLQLEFLGKKYRQSKHSSLVDKKGKNVFKKWGMSNYECLRQSQFLAQKHLRFLMGSRCHKEFYNCKLRWSIVIRLILWVQLLVSRRNAILSWVNFIPHFWIIKNGLFLGIKVNILLFLTTLLDMQNHISL